MTVTLARTLAPDVRVNAAAPLKKVCQAEDVSKVVVDLVTSDLMTGQVVVVDGGMGIKG